MSKNTAIYALVILVSVLIGFYIYKEYINSPAKHYQNVTNQEVAYQSILAKELKANIDNKNEMFLIDVHTPEQEHIKGTNVFIPFDKISENSTKLPKNKDTKIVVYCRSGGMSPIAAKKLVEMGYTNVSDLEGGINAWKQEGY